MALRSLAPHRFLPTTGRLYHPARRAYSTPPSHSREGDSNYDSRTNTLRSPNVASVPANDPAPKPPKPNVSATNAAPTSSEGSFDQVLQESVERGEELRVMQAPNRQAPNRKGLWSRSQQPREVAMTGPRFEQTIYEDQVREPVLLREVDRLIGRWIANMSWRDATNEEPESFDHAK